jgi:hypothetical protein
MAAHRTLIFDVGEACFWSEEELNQMRAMVETGVPQWQITKTFPDCT